MASDAGCLAYVCGQACLGADPLPKPGPARTT
jgi:hypothetical protein